MKDKFYIAVQADLVDHKAKVPIHTIARAVEKGLEMMTESKYLNCDDEFKISIRPHPVTYGLEVIVKKKEKKGE